MDTVAGSCKTERHHPEWSNTYNRVFVRWTTHNPVGLSEKDTKMAAICDEVAQRPDSLEQPDGDTSMNAKLSQTATQSADGVCCGPSQAQSNKEKEKQEIEEVEEEEGARGSVSGIGGQPT